jgi:hypothetical protein
MQIFKPNINRGETLPSKILKMNTQEKKLIQDPQTYISDSDSLEVFWSERAKSYVLQFNGRYLFFKTFKAFLSNKIKLIKKHNLTPIN